MPLREWWQHTAAILFLPLLLGAPAMASAPTGHAHAPLPADPALTLERAVDAALAAYPDAPLLEARQNEAEAWNRRGRSLIQGRPSLMLRYQSDRLGTDVNLEEREAGIELPLWSWGGRKAVQDFGDAITSESIAAHEAMRWEVAGIVRQSLWTVALADNAHELAEQSLETAARLVTTVERRHALGDLALRDLMLAQASQLEYETALIDASAALLDAERTFRTLTGLDRRPDYAAETLSAIDDITSAHPAVVLADLALERAQANVEVARQTANAGATVLIGTRHERPALGTAFDDSLGITVSIPFGGSAYRDTQTSAAARAAKAALAARNHELRMLTLDMHEAAHGLAVVRENQATASQRLALAERQQEMAESAYEKGEIELIDLLKIHETAIAARRQVMRLEIDRKRQTALYNQAVGVLP